MRKKHKHFLVKVAATLIALGYAGSRIDAQTSPPIPQPMSTSAQAEALMAADVWLDSVQAYEHIPSLSAAIVQGDRKETARRPHRLVTRYGTLDAARERRSGTF